MENDSPPPLHDDPEIAALLAFEPVVRKCKRSDGWTDDNQRIYIVGLAETGNPAQAAQRVERTASGAWKVRTSAGGKGFAAAWDAALALYHRRNPRPLPKGRPSRGEILAGSGRAWPAAPAAAPGPDWVDPTIYYLTQDEFVDGILRKYWLKLGQERIARLQGRIVEADFYVRQLTWLEVALDLGGNADELLEGLKRGGTDVMNIVATPMSVLLDNVRRTLWAKMGEPERPEPPPLGEHDGEVSTGERNWFSSDRDGPDDGPFWRERQERAAIRAKAQAAWEEKARAEAEAWAARVEGDDPEARP